MNKFIARLDNVAANITLHIEQHGGPDGIIDPKDEKLMAGVAHDINKIKDDLRAANVRPGMTAQEYEDVQLLNDINQRNAGCQDGLDVDLQKAIQEVQKIIMLRAGSRSWQDIHADRAV